MEDNFIDYGKLIDDAMHVIVKKVLEMASQTGVPGDHHFFISFVTNHPGVQISDKLRKKYNDEMTVVLQHQFEDLRVTDEEISVILSFDGTKERVIIPFEALSAFADPSVKFGLQFRQIGDSEDDDYLDDVVDLLEDGIYDDPDLGLDTIGSENEAKKDNKSGSLPSSKSKKSSSKGKKPTPDNVVSLDKFRKK